MPQLAKQLRGKTIAHLDIRHSRYCLLNALQGVDAPPFFLRQDMYCIILSLHSPRQGQLDLDEWEATRTIVVEWK